MAIRNLIVRSGVGPGATVPFLVTRGLSIGEVVVPVATVTSRHTVSPRYRRHSVSRTQ